MKAGGLLAVALVALVTAGCGGGSSGGESGTSLPAVGSTTIETTLPETTAAPVVIEVPPAGRPLGPTSRGPEVVALQRALIDLGYKPGKPDGFYGQKTRKAVSAFQREHRLPVDGLVGPKTARAINKALASAGK